jgi:hypothetical protein
MIKLKLRRLRKFKKMLALIEVKVDLLLFQNVKLQWIKRRLLPFRK